MRLTQTQCRRRRGQTMMEYVLIICLIAAAIAGAVYFFGDKMRESINQNTELVGSAAGETSRTENGWSNKSSGAPNGTGGNDEGSGGGVR